MFASVFLLVGVALGDDALAPVSTSTAGSVTPAPTVSTTVPSLVVENAKLSSKDWVHYKGCDDTCLSLCLENPTGYDTKCSVLFSNSTKTVHPTSETCAKIQVSISSTFYSKLLCTQITKAQKRLMA